MISGHDLPAPAPVLSPESRPFWEAAAEGRLLLQRCDDCGGTVWYPRGICPDCGGTALAWFEASGRGVVYSFTVIRRGATGAFRDVGPYVLAYVELDEGPRVLTNLVDCDPGALLIGQAVRAVFEAAEDGTAVLRFRPDGRRPGGGGG